MIGETEPMDENGDLTLHDRRLLLMRILVDHCNTNEITLDGLLAIVGRLLAPDTTGEPTVAFPARRLPRSYEDTWGSSVTIDRDQTQVRYRYGGAGPGDDGGERCFSYPTADLYQYLQGLQHTLNGTPAAGQREEG